MKRIVFKAVLIQLILSLGLFYFLIRPPGQFADRYYIRLALERINKMQKLIAAGGLTGRIPMGSMNEGLRNRMGKAAAGMLRILPPQAELFRLNHDLSEMEPLLQVDAGSKKIKKTPPEIIQMIEKAGRKGKGPLEITRIEKLKKNERIIHLVKKVGPVFIYYRERFRNDILSAMHGYYRNVSLLYFLVSSLILVVYIMFEYQRLRDDSLEQEKEYSERLKEWQLLSAGIAHEIKNPLGSISMFSELLKRKAGNSEPESEYLDCIFKEIGRLNNIVSNYLSFSRPPDVNKEKHSLTDLVDEMLEDFRKRNPGLDFVHEPARDLPGFFFDRDKIRQVLLNLIKNATESLQSSETEKGKVTVSEELKGRTVRLLIRDNGPGLSEDPDRVMQPFYTSKTQGSGLGLSISYQIIRSHNGEMKLSSQDGGCSVEIILPYQRSGQ